MSNRIGELKAKLSQSNIDGMIVTNPVSVRYLTGLTAEGTLLITKQENVFITDGRYIEEVNSRLTINDGIICYDYNDLNEEDDLNFFADCEKVGFEEKYVTYVDYSKFLVKYRIKELVEASKFIEKQRMVKDENEIACIEKACNITDSCFLHLLDFIKVGMTEKEIVAEIVYFFLQNGADGEAFDTIVATGPNSSKPHATPTDRKILPGDPILIDFGAKYKGYCADMTRTIFAGQPSEEDAKLYEFLLAVQKRAELKIKDGASGMEIAKGVETELQARGYDLIHGLGHGVGIEIHEKPVLSHKVNWDLQENNVVTCEPGIYIPGRIGIRIEDTVLVKKLESRSLTKSNKNLLTI